MHRLLYLFPFTESLNIALQYHFRIEGRGKTFLAQHLWELNQNFLLQFCRERFKISNDANHLPISFEITFQEPSGQVTIVLQHLLPSDISTGSRQNIFGISLIEEYTANITSTLFEGMCFSSPSNRNVESELAIRILRSDSHNSEKESIIIVDNRTAPWMRI